MCRDYVLDVMDHFLHVVLKACIDEEKVTETGEETMVESLYPARHETLYCGLTLQKHAKTLKYRVQSPGKNSS